MTASPVVAETIPRPSDWGRGVLVGLACGVVLAGALVVARDVMAGRTWSMWLENAAAPWLLTAFVAGRASRRIPPGALAGVLALLLGLAGYELIEPSSGGITPFVVVRPFWVAASIGAGALFGGLGGSSSSLREAAWMAPGLVAGAIAAEAMTALFAGPGNPAFTEKGAVLLVLVALAAAWAMGPHRSRWAAAGTAAGTALVVTAVQALTGLPAHVLWGL